MNRLHSAALLCVLAVFAGCASTPPKAGDAPAAAAEPARIAPAVAVPAASAAKVVLAMTGPANVTGAKDWPDFQREWRETFAEYAKQKGIAFSFAEGEAKPTGEDGTLLAVEVADYRMVGIGSRIMFGIMTGNAFIEAKVRFVNLRDGSVFGEQQYSTSSSAAAGIFAKVTPQQVNAIGQNIFLDLKPARP